MWLKELELQGPRKRLSRTQMISLKEQGISSPHLLMDGSANLDAMRQLAVPTQNGINFPNLVRNAAKLWKVNEREYFKTKHKKRSASSNCTPLVEAVYAEKGTALETAVINIFDAIGVSSIVLDDGNNPAWPDLKLNFEALGVGPDIVVEVKSKESETALVSLNGAIEVLAAAQLVGLSDHPCMTICSPGVEPSVQTAIASCNNLAVLEVSELVEAVLRFKDGNLSLSDLYDWLVTPGVALREDLPFTNR